MEAILPFGQINMAHGSTQSVTAHMTTDSRSILGGINMQSPNSFVLTKAEKQLIELVRSVEYGELRIMVKDAKPIRVEEIRRSIQLQSDK